MKRCSKCKVEKELTEFSKHSPYDMARRNTTHNTICRKCVNERTRKYWRNDDGLWWVYLLEKENYVGQTHSWKKRFLNHRKDGRYADDMKVLHRVDTEEEALRLESEYHNKGYKGKHTNAKKETHSD